MNNIIQFPIQPEHYWLSFDSAGTPQLYYGRVSPEYARHAKTCGEEPVIILTKYQVTQLQRYLPNCVIQPSAKEKLEAGAI